MQNTGPRGTILERLSDEALLDLYIEYKRQDILRMGRGAREAEQSIEAYVDWRRRRKAWEASPTAETVNTCPYCKRNPVQRLTPSGVCCRTCFMTRPQCDVEGCRNLQMSRYSKCIKHQATVAKGEASYVDETQMDRAKAAIRSNLPAL